MLTELCGYLKNWFVTERFYGDFVVSGNSITRADGTELPIQKGQHFCIVGSIFNDGVYCNNEELTLHSEGFNGAVWAMAIPREVFDLAKDIKAWRDKYEGSDSVAMSPYNSESFGGYSYSKSNGNTADGNGASWQSIFRNRLNRYRKV